MRSVVFSLIKAVRIIRSLSCKNPFCAIVSGLRFSKASEEQIPTAIREETIKRVNCHKNSDLPLFRIEKDTRGGVLHAPFACVLMVDRGGFEPPKSKTSDLQSDPFGRSGICPILYAFLFRKISVTCRRKGWCLKVESNRRQRDFQSLALPTELSRQDFFSSPDRSSFVLKYYFSTGKRVKKWRPKRGSNS